MKKKLLYAALIVTGISCTSFGFNFDWQLAEQQVKVKELSDAVPARVSAAKETTFFIIGMSPLQMVSY